MWSLVFEEASSPDRAVCLNFDDWWSAVTV